MKFTALRMSGAWVIDLEPRTDDRGFFARTFCARDFEAHGLSTDIVQANMSYNHKRGTMRGMHYQVEPAVEPKLVRCTRGVVYDVIVDLRRDSPTYLQHFGVELSADNHRALYVPPLFAHGYLTLTDDSEVTYNVGGFYQPEYERGLRHDDQMLGIEWPIAVTSISPKDESWALIGTAEQPVQRELAEATLP